MNCFQLISKQTGEPANFHDVDEALCNMLGVPVDPERFVYSWYGIIGMAAACGHTFKKMREEIFVDAEPTALKIIDYLDEHYIIKCWVQSHHN